MKKPVVSKLRKKKTIRLVSDVDMELPLDKLITKFNEILANPSEDWINIPRVDYEYYGYDGGKDLHIVVDVWAETEQEWKDRVAKEQAALDAYNVHIQKKKDTEAYIKELEEKLAKLENNK